MKSKAAYFGVFIALALIFSYVETLIPIQVGIPGVKLGLANLVVVVVLYKMGIKEAYTLAVVRVILSGFLFGNLFSIVYSLAGWTSQSDGDGRFKKDKSVQFAWNQCDGRRFSQCWPVNHGCSCIGEFEHWILSSSFTYIGACDRNFDWYHLW